MSFRAIGLVASNEPILMPFSTPQPHVLPSADNKATEAANNKQRLGVRHYIAVHVGFTGFGKENEATRRAERVGI
jgi:hypothetical protein